MFFCSASFQAMVMPPMVLSRFGAGPLIAQLSAKEMNHGHSQNG